MTRRALPVSSRTRYSRRETVNWQNGATLGFAMLVLLVLGLAGMATIEERYQVDLPIVSRLAADGSAKAPD